MVCPSLLRVLNRSIISFLVLEFKFPVGSSAIRISGEFTKVLAIATLSCSPPESWSGSFLSFPRNPCLFSKEFLTKPAFPGYMTLEGAYI